MSILSSAYLPLPTASSSHTLVLLQTTKPIADLARAFCNADKPKHVVLEFRGEKASTYEAESTEAAQNIVNKLERARKL
jgi:hypothetical protein